MITSQYRIQATESAGAENESVGIKAINKRVAVIPALLTHCGDITPNLAELLRAGE